jgi:hypothetical protein
VNRVPGLSASTCSRIVGGPGTSRVTVTSYQRVSVTYGKPMTIQSFPLCAEPVSSFPAAVVLLSVPFGCTTPIVPMNWSPFRNSCGSVIVMVLMPRFPLR